MIFRVSGGLGLAALLSSCAAVPPEAESALASFATASHCTAFTIGAAEGAPVDGLVITASSWQQAGAQVPSREGVALPAHCLVEGYFAEREGTIAGPYRIAFRMRLPADWNGRFFFQGGGGTNGVVGDATGPNGAGNTLALVRGYAVIAQDSGHDNTLNFLADHGGQMVFGHDPQARRDYIFSSLKPVYDLGRHLQRAFYGRDSDTEIFWGCSKGGQEGVAFAQRYPEAFDGIVAMAPAISLPRASLAETWDTQALARIFTATGEVPSVDGMRRLFSPEQYGLVSQAVLEACDGLDGREDGVVAALGMCTTARVEPQLRARMCETGDDCLSGAQVNALLTIMGGPQDSVGNPLYAPWPWDAGIGSPGWAVWKTGLVDGPPAINVALAGQALPAIFSTPPTALPFDPERALEWQLAFDFDEDAPTIYAAAPPFSTSSWEDFNERSPDLAAFSANGGRLIVPHGTSDPVFSVLDSTAWWDEVNAASGGNAADFTRVFPVPGMAHCGGGPATDRFDSLTALEEWVLQDDAPDAIMATAGDDTPFPGREMPLCPYPQIALPAREGQYRCGELGALP